MPVELRATAPTPFAPANRPDAASDVGAVVASRVTPFSEDLGIRTKPYRAELETILVSQGTPARGWYSDASSFNRAKPAQYEYRLTVEREPGEVLFDKTFRDRPDFAIAPNGDLAIDSRFSFSPRGTRRLDVYRMRDGQLEHARTLGRRGFWSRAEQDVSSFAWSPSGDKLIFSTRSYDRIDAKTPFSDGDRGHVYRTFLYEPASDAVRELGYAKPQQLGGGSYTHNQFVWSKNGDWVGFSSASPSYFFLFDAKTGKHAQTFQTREELGYQGSGSVPVKGIADDGTPQFGSLARSEFRPLPIGSIIPLGE